jgi:hypothetical protein
MTRNRKSKKDTRSRAAAHGISYTTARRGDPDQPDGEPLFGPKSLPPGPSVEALATQRLLARQHPLSLWAPLYSKSASDFTRHVREHRLADKDLTARLLALREPLVAVAHGCATHEEQKAVWGSGDLPPRTPGEPALWLAGTLLDAAGFGAVSILTEEGLLTLRDELIDEAKEREDDLDGTVQLLGSWLQDAAMLKGGADMSLRLVYLGDERPLIHRDLEARDEPWNRAHLTVVAKEAFELLADWDLHVNVAYDGTPRNPFDPADAERDRSIFETGRGIAIYDAGAYVSGPVPPAPIPTRGAFGSGAKSHPTPFIDPYAEVAKRLRAHGLTVDTDDLRARLRPGVQSVGTSRGIPSGLADTQWTDEVIASFVSAAVAEARATGRTDV